MATLRFAYTSVPLERAFRLTTESVCMHSVNFNSTRNVVFSSLHGLPAVPKHRTFSSEHCTKQVRWRLSTHNITAACVVGRHVIRIRMELHYGIA
jgi:hypothetical protein